MPHNASIEAVAAETGYPIHEVRSRGVTFCRKNPRNSGDDFDQSLPDDFERAVVRANLSDAGRELSSFPVDFFHGAQAEPYKRGVDLRDAFPDPADFAEARQVLLDEGELTVGGGASGDPVTLRPSRPLPATAATVAEDLRVSHQLMDDQRALPFGGRPSVDGRLPLSMRRDPVKGGVAIVCRLGFRDILVSPALADAEADALEPAYRAAAEAFRGAAPADLPLAG